MKKLPQKRWMSLWRHFYDREQTVADLTQSMLNWQRKWNWDFLKLNPPACYHVLDWGAEYEFFTDPLKEPAMRRPADLSKVGPLDVTKGKLGEQLQVIRNLRRELGPDLPIFETVFSPLEIAHRLFAGGREELLQMLRSRPAEAHRLLETIKNVFCEFCSECLEAGADGIFFATKWATSDLLTWDEYQEFGRNYDKYVLATMRRQDAGIILHVCGARTYLEQLLAYPVHFFSYDFFAEGALLPEQVVEQTGKYVMGGIDPDRVLTNLPSVIADCKRFAKIDKWLIGPSCVILPQTPDSAVESLASLRIGG